MFRHMTWAALSMVALAWASEARADDWQRSSPGFDMWYRHASYSADTDEVYVRVFYGTPGLSYDKAMMTNYELEKSFSCSRVSGKVRFITTDIRSDMGWSEADAITDGDLRKSLCARKSTLPPWLGETAP